MRALALLYLSSLRAKYWFIPTLLAIGAIVLSVVAVSAEQYLGSDWLERIPWFYANEPAGARAVLSTIAGSMVTVAGVTFSITIAALATTASTFGPRLINNFMQDRGNQIVLGTFIATFLFCLLVLRTVRGGDEQLGAFVPHIAIVISLLFALASLGVLIYFIHHIPETIHISNVVARLGRDLADQVEEMFPQELGEPPPAGEDATAILAHDGAATVPTGAPGYVQYVDADGLMAFATRHDVVVELCCRPGDFLTDVSVIARVEGDVSASVLEGVRRAVVVGDYRSQQQDILYLVDRLVEVAARALSPGMNDIFTAKNAIDWMGNGLIRLARRDTPIERRRDKHGTVRVLARPRTFEEITAAVFDRMRPYVQADPNAGLHLMRTLGGVAGATINLRRRAVLLTHAKALHAACLKSLDHPRDREALAAAYEEVVALLSTPYSGSAAAPGETPGGAPAPDLPRAALNRIVGSGGETHPGGAPGLQNR